jgi:ribosomal protein S18 acetylase RimI-like enzyme
MHIRSFSEPDTAAVVQLWGDCGLIRAWNDPLKDIARKLTVQPELFLVGVEDGAVVASAMFGFDGHRGWVNYLAVSPAARGRGFGRELMVRGEQLLTAAGCPKLSLQVRDGNDAALGFYRALGYAVDPVVSLGKRLIPDS